ncbi:MAG: SRPBCC family protein [Candidatus Lambdaproteobacteria bacterium]|nr:SRPBCC family protein [Candidatus Lambdaproteobacteria bacterium]
MGAVERYTLTLPSPLEIVLTRNFAAPRALVFQAHTQPAHLVHWWGRTGSTLPVCEIDLRPGGAWRFVERQSDGREYGFRGTYREIVPPQRLVYTFEFEGTPGHVVLVSATFDEVDGMTRLTSRSRFHTAEDRNGMLQSGMEAGAAESCNRLEEYLAALS